MIGTCEATARQIERILQSDTLRSAEGLRRLLRYLAEKTFSGEADDLKEYTVGVEGLGKPSAYDPRYESGVRIQIGRLRQKLIEYYYIEGRDDSIVAELPKGRFKLSFEYRQGASATRAEPSESHEARGVAAAGDGFRSTISILLLLACAWGFYASVQFWRQQRQTVLFRNSWPEEVYGLWRLFLSPERPLIVAIADPPFADVLGLGMYGDRTSTDWDDLMQTRGAAALQKGYDSSQWRPYPFLTGTAEASAAFELGRLLGLRVPHMSVVRSSELSWQQFADNNMILVGPAAFFQDQLRSLPVELEFMQNANGIEILHPRPGDPPIPALGCGEVRGTGRQYALVSTTPGPAGNGVVRTFTSVGTSARLAALQSFSDPFEARTLLRNLAGRAGKAPQFFQVVLRVTYTDGVATNTEYILHRELHLKTSKRHYTRYSHTGTTK